MQRERYTVLTSVDGVGSCVSSSITYGINYDKDYYVSRFITIGNIIDENSDTELPELIKKDQYTEEDFTYLVLANTGFLKQIQNPSQKLLETGYKKNKKAYQYFSEHNEEQSIEVVRENGLYLEFIKDQTLEIALEAIKENVEAMQFVKPEFLVNLIQRIDYQFIFEMQSVQTSKNYQMKEQDFISKMFKYYKDDDNLRSIFLYEFKFHTHYLDLVYPETIKDFEYCNIFRLSPEYIFQIPQDKVTVKIFHLYLDSHASTEYLDLINTNFPNFNAKLEFLKWGISNYSSMKVFSPLMDSYFKYQDALLRKNCNLQIENIDNKVKYYLERIQMNTIQISDLFFYTVLHRYIVPNQYSKNMSLTIYSKNRFINKFYKLIEKKLLNKVFK